IREHVLSAYYSQNILDNREQGRGLHLLTAASLNNLALLKQDQGELADAKPLYERALMIRRDWLGPDDRETAASLNNLALLLQALGEFDDARPLYREAL